VILLIKTIMEVLKVSTEIFHSPFSILPLLYICVKVYIPKPLRVEENNDE